MIKGLIHIIGFALLVYLAGFLLANQVESPWVHGSMNTIIGFIAGVHVIIHIVTERIKNRLKIEYHMLLLAGVAARLILSLFGLIFLSTFGIEDLRIFALNFSIVYLLFLVFEITTVLSNLRPNSSRHRQS